MPVLLTTAYFPPVQYFAALSQEAILRRGGKSVVVAPAMAYIEASENYQKQSYRNRCHFYTASGMQSLSFPVLHGENGYSLPIKEIKVDYSVPWIRQHKTAIVSAYRTSAFFEYYQDELFSILDSRPGTLWELNISLIQFFVRKIGIPVELTPTDDFTKSEGNVGEGLWKGLPYNPALDAVDIRAVIHPKRPDDILARLGKEKPYFQVFARKHGFIPNLSIMDLLFNEGPDSISYLVRTPDVL